MLAKSALAVSAGEGAGAPQLGENGLGTEAQAPRVSVIMANYNCASHVGAAVRSVLDQTLASLELILSDDGSTDSSLDRAREAAAGDPRLRIVEGPPRSGPAAARNRAIRGARGDFVAVVDSDDLIRPDRLERLTACAERDGADIVADDLEAFYDDGARRPHGLLAGRWAGRESWVSAEDYVRANMGFTGTTQLGFLKPVIRRSALRGAAYDETLRIGEDYDLIVRLLLSGARMRIYPERLYSYRRHAASISHRIRPEHLDALLAANDRTSAAASDPAIARLLGRRRASIEGARAFASLVDALKARAWASAAKVAVTRPSTLWELRTPVIDRLARWARPRPPLAGA